MPAILYIVQCTSSHRMQLNYITIFLCVYLRSTRNRGNYNFTRDRLTHHVHLIRLQQLIKRAPFVESRSHTFLCAVLRTIYLYISLCILKYKIFHLLSHLHRFTIRIRANTPLRRRSLAPHFINFHPLKLLCYVYDAFFSYSFAYVFTFNIIQRIVYESIWL